MGNTARVGNGPCAGSNPWSSNGQIYLCVSCPRDLMRVRRGSQQRRVSARVRCGPRRCRREGASASTWLHWSLPGRLLLTGHAFRRALGGGPPSGLDARACVSASACGHAAVGSTSVLQAVSATLTLLVQAVGIADTGHRLERTPRCSFGASPGTGASVQHPARNEWHRVVAEFALHLARRCSRAVMWGRRQRRFGVGATRLSDA